MLLFTSIICSLRYNFKLICVADHNDDTELNITQQYSF